MITANQAHKLAMGQSVERDGLFIEFEQCIVAAAERGDFGVYLAVNATALKMLRDYGYWVNAAVEPEDDNRSERMFVDWSGRFNNE